MSVALSIRNDLICSSAIIQVRSTGSMVAKIQRVKMSRIAVTPRVLGVNATLFDSLNLERLDEYSILKNVSRLVDQE